MTQENLKDYFLNKDCYIYKTKHKDDGVYYFMRRNGRKKMVVLFPPKTGKYTEVIVCHFCTVLEIEEIPSYAINHRNGYNTVTLKTSIIDDLPPTGNISN